MERLQELLDLFGDQPWLRAAAAVVIGFLAAYVVDFLVRRVLRVIAKATPTGADDQILNLFHRPVRTTVVLLGFWVAVQQLNLTPAADAPAGTTNWELLLGRMLQTLGLFVWTGFAFRFVKMFLQASARDTRRIRMVEPATLPLFDNLGKILVFGGACYLGVRFWGGDAKALLTSAGVAGIAIGFAAKDTLANLFSGVFIIADAPYRLGDYIVLDSGERGKVVDIGLRSTRLLTRDDLEIIIPNAVMGAAKILNETGGPASHRRLRIPVGVAYGSDVDRVRAVLMQSAANEPHVIEEPTPRVRFRKFGDSTLDFELLCWIAEPELRGKATDALLTRIYKAFQDAEIEIAFPQLDVHLHRD